MRRLFLAIGLVIAAHSATVPGQGVESSGAQLAIRADRLIDVNDGVAVRDAVVLIKGDRIVAAGSKVTIPPGVNVIDLGSLTLLPGLIDAHTHITGGDPRDY